MKRINPSGLWAVVALLLIVVLTTLFIYIDFRFGAETSAFLLGALLGIPFLLVVVVIVGGIFILVIRGTSHLQEQDDKGEIERLRALRELARTERAMNHNEKSSLDAQLKLFELWQAQQKQDGGDAGISTSYRALPDHGWPDEEDDNESTGGGNYRILD